MVVVLKVKLTDTIENKSHEFDIIVDLYPENFYGEQFMVTKAGECHKALGVMQGLFKNKYPAVRHKGSFGTF